MKVVRKGDCEPKPIEMDSKAIPMDTVFSGKPTATGICYDRGVFIRCEGGFLRLSYDSGHSPKGHVFDVSAVINDYKELNAYLCIEE